MFINTHALQENVNIDFFVQSLYNMYHDRSFLLAEEECSVLKDILSLFENCTFTWGNAFVYSWEEMADV